MAIWLRLINAVLYLAACGLLASGLVLEYRLEPEDEGPRLLGLSGETWAELHVVLGLVVAGLVAVHLALHWAWIRGLLKRLRWPTLLILAAGAALVAVVLAVPVVGSTAHDSEDEDRGIRQEYQRSHD